MEIYETKDIVNVFNELRLNLLSVCIRMLRNLFGLQSRL